LKKIAVLMAIIMLTVITSSAMASSKGSGHYKHEAKVGKLFLFQKCDENGCPEEGAGPWPILPTARWGQIQYNLLGDKFRFSFEGKKLVTNTDYTLIYYPDPWPGDKLICLGTGKTNRCGNLQIHGDMEIMAEDGEGGLVNSGLPASYDANFNPTAPSGSVGAKIWLVLSEDVNCGDPEAVPPVKSSMIGWTPQDYLFEGNLIVYQYSEEQSKRFRKK
jgi:hypothetical protein